MKKILLFLLITSCMTPAPTKLKTVNSVDINRYSGTWYEILRLPNRFEKGLKCITATYTLDSRGKIKVLNKGYMIDNPAKADEATGKAWVPDPAEPGKLKVSFFWPFSGKYWILYLDEEYRYVLIGEPSLKYLWILSRTPSLPEDIVQDLLKKAVDMGYETKQIIRVDHNCK